MIKTILAGAFALFTTFASASSFEDIKDNTLKLYSNGVPICSAEVIDFNTVVTAAHCVTADNNLSFYSQRKNADGKVTFESNVFLDVEYVNVEDDVAILTPRELRFFGVGVDVATEKEIEEYLTLGTEVIAAGYPFVEEFALTEGLYNGLVEAPTPLNVKGKVFFSSTWIVGGSSGGGLYIKIGDELKLIGIASGGREHLSIFTPISHLREALEKVNVGR